MADNVVYRSGNILPPSGTIKIGDITLDKLANNGNNGCREVRNGVSSTEVITVSLVLMAIIRNSHGDYTANRVLAALNAGNVPVCSDSRYTFEGWTYKIGDQEFPTFTTNVNRQITDWPKSSTTYSVGIQWKDNGGSSVTTQVTLTLDAGNGTFKSNNSRWLTYTGTPDTVVTLPNVNDVTCSGWTLAGFGDYNDERVWHQPGTTFTIKKNETKEAKYTPATVTPTGYTVTFDGNCNTSGSAPSTIYNTTRIASSPYHTLARTGFDFVGWSTNYAPAENATPITFPYTVTKNTTLYAIWKTSSPVTPTKATITLDPNCGAFPGKQINETTSVSVNVNSTFYFSSYKPTRSGFDLIGWNHNISSQVTEYGTSGQFTVTKSDTFKAVWQASTPTTTYYNVQLSANGGTFATSVKYSYSNVTKGFTFYLPTASQCTRSGYTLKEFIGSDGTSYTPGSLYTVKGNDIVTAQWTQSTTASAPGMPHWVTTGLDWTNKKKKVKVGDYVTLKWTAPTTGGTPTYYSIVCSKSNLVSSTVQYPNTQVSFYIPTGFTSATFTISACNATGCSLADGPITLELEEEIDPNPQIEYAYIHYNGCGVEATNMPKSPEQVKRYTSVQISPLIPEYPNKSKTFSGWDTSALGASVKYRPGDIISNFSFNNLSLYAVWGDNKCSVWFYPNGGTVYGTSGAYKVLYLVDKPYGDTVSAFPQPRRDGYDFAGWYTQASGGTEVKEEHICTGEISLYAHWSSKTIATPVWTTTAVKCKPSGSSKVYWKKGDFNETRTLIYEIRNASTLAILATNIGATEWEYTAPSSFTGISLQVRAYTITDDGTKIYSSWSEILTLGLDKGSAPMDPSWCYINRSKQPPTIYTNVSNMQEYKNYDVSWASVVDPDGDLVGYKVEYSLFNGTSWGTWRAQPNVIGNTNCQYPSSALAGFEQVKYRVAGYDNMGNVGGWCESAPVTISTKRPPTAPGSITVPDQNHLPVSQRNGVIEASKEYKISWTASTDPDGDLAGYRLEESINGGEWKNADTTYPSVTYAYRSQPSSIKTVRYRVQAYDKCQLTSDWTYSVTKTIFNNTPPTTPAWITIPDPSEDMITDKEPFVKGGEPFLISWAASSDAENNLAGYELQRSLDGDPWVTIATTVDNFYTEMIDKTQAYHSSVAYKVRAYDDPGEGMPSLYSDWCTSKTYNVSNNASPVVVARSGTHIIEKGEYFGVVENGFSFQIDVTDEENDDVDVEVAILQDGMKEDKKTVLGTFEGRRTPLHTVFTINEELFQTLPMATMRVIITAKDSEGYGQTTFTFTRKSTRAFLTLKEPITYPEFIEGVRFTRLLGSFPSDCIMKVEVTNNANDREGTVKWEECTDYARGYHPYQFKNKIVWRPAFNFRITCNRGASGAGGYISRVSGYFVTANTEQQF